MILVLGFKEGLLVLVVESLYVLFFSFGEGG